MPQAKKKTSKPKADINIHIEGDKGWVDSVKERKPFCWMGWHTWHPIHHCDAIGPALAVVLSYTRNQSILLAIVHGILSWLYVIYRGIQVLGWI